MQIFQNHLAVILCSGMSWGHCGHFQPHPSRDSGVRLGRGLSAPGNSCSLQGALKGNSEGCCDNVLEVTLSQRPRTENPCCCHLCPWLCHGDGVPVAMPRAGEAFPTLRRRSWAWLSQPCPRGSPGHPSGAAGCSSPFFLPWIC